MSSQPPQTTMPFVSAPPPVNPLGVPRFPQQQTQWCWAACAEMVLEFYSFPNVDQCDLANIAFPQAGGACCNNPSSSLCDKPLSDAEICRLWANKGIKYSYVNSFIPFTTLQSEINAGRPVEVAFTLSNGGHVVIVQGWSQTPMGPYLFVNDPAGGAGQGLVSYQHLLTAKGSGSWDATWTGLRK